MNSRKSGFALVIALSLMAFVLLLLLSMTTLVQVEGQSSEVSKKQLQARQNAILGAMVALGDIQKYAGPDQRVTARSDILIPPTTSPIEGQAQWTGVWSSKADTSNVEDTAVGLNARQPRWLVSGDSVVDPLNPATALDPDNSVLLAKSFTATDSSVGNSVENESQTVRARLVDVSSDKADSDGQFAYWVSDEGVKARVNLPDTFHPGSSDANAYYRQALAQQADASVVESMDDSRPYSGSGSASIWKQLNSPAAKISTVAELELAASDASQVSANAAREFFHDFTAHSVGLLTNTRDGGFKRDLSTILRKFGSTPPQDMVNRTIFPDVTGNYTVGVGQSEDPGGPQWAQLADYYKKCLENSTLSSSAAIPMTTETKNDEVSILPIVSRVNMILQPIAEFKGGDTDDAADYQYRLGIFPLYTLWNPYDRPLNVDGLVIYTQATKGKLVELDAAAGASPQDLMLLKNPKAKKTAQVNIFSGGPFSTGKFDGSRRFVGFTVSLDAPIPPGEAINVSPPNNSLYSSDVSKNVLKPGSAGDAVRGFFTAAVNTTSAVQPNSYKMSELVGSLELSRVRLSGYGVNPLLTILSSSSTKNSGDAGNGRLAVISMAAGIPNNENVLCRVIDIDSLESLTGTKFDLKSEGSSDTDQQTYDTPFDLVTMRQLTHDDTATKWPGTFMGASRQMSFAKSSLRAVASDKDYGSERVHLFTQLNPRAPFLATPKHQNDGVASGRLRYRMYDLGAYDDVDPERHLNFTYGATSEKAYVGLGSSFATQGSEKMVLFEAPTRPPLGIGQLMHANLTNIARLSNQVQQNLWRSNLQQLAVTPTYAIGNSFASIYMPLGETRMHIRDQLSEYYSIILKPGFKWGRGTHYDYSYELNDALWDRYFFSTILPDSPVSPAVDPDADRLFPLPNSRIKKWDQSTNGSELFLEERAASNLELHGAFNINSTSVAAWESVLGALRDVETLNASSPVDPDSRHNYSRMAAPQLSATGKVPDYLRDKDTISAGFRSLTDENITALAASIVREIKIRRSGYGFPFLSLAQFINRELIDPQNVPQGALLRFAYCGPLQSAIDQSAVNGKPALDENWDPVSSGEGLWENGYITELPNFSTTIPFHPESLEVIKNRPFAEGAPGSLIQADILAKIGAIITPRSDTFTIRSYGGTQKLLAAELESQAYYEIVVRRTPAYLDDTDDNYDLPVSLLNKRFGRRFEVVSSRWISPDEI